MMYQEVFGSWIVELWVTPISKTVHAEGLNHVYIYLIDGVPKIENLGTQPDPEIPPKLIVIMKELLKR